MPDDNDYVLLGLQDEPGFLTDPIREVIGRLSVMFAVERMHDSEFVPTLVPVGGKHLAMVDYQAEARIRAAQVLAASAALLHLEPECSALVLAHDTFMSQFAPGEVPIDAVDDLPPPSEDPAATEALGLFVARKVLFQVECKSTALPYGRTDDGRLEWRLGLGWMSTPNAPMDMALRIALEHRGDDPPPEAILDELHVEIVALPDLGATWN